ncbi:MAG: DUF3109 family protein [Bacteroidota bacterium]|nr:DUF3109 family protein [Bacteroidota bacterium]
MKKTVNGKPLKIIDYEVFSLFFCCDLTSCKGACCTFPGGMGAPVDEDELDILEKSFLVVSPILPKEHIDIVERFGLIDSSNGSYYIRCFNNRACVFVYFDGEIAKCSIQKAFLDGTLDWAKPRSCHLFPLRYDGFGGGRLRFEYFEGCAPALKNGKARNIPLLRFTADALVRIIGEKQAVTLIRSVDKEFGLESVS